MILTGVWPNYLYLLFIKFYQLNCIARCWNFSFLLLTQTWVDSWRNCCELRTARLLTWISTSNWFFSLSSRSICHMFNNRLWFCPSSLSIYFALWNLILIHIIIGRSHYLLILLRLLLYFLCKSCPTSSFGHYFDTFLIFFITDYCHIFWLRRTSDIRFISIRAIWSCPILIRHHVDRLSLFPFLWIVHIISLERIIELRMCLELLVSRWLDCRLCPN